MNKLTPSWKPEEYEEYLNLKAAEQKRNDEAKKDYHKHIIQSPSFVVESVPPSKVEEVLRVAKLEVIGQEMEKAKQQIIKLNSPFKEKEIAALKLNYRNFCRQLNHFETKKRLLEKGTEVKDKDGKKFELFDLLYIIDKLRMEIELMKLDLKLYGLSHDNCIGSE